jgi:hypothetical protein
LNPFPETPQSIRSLAIASFLVRFAIPALIQKIAEIRLPAEKALPSKKKRTKRLTERMYIWECEWALANFNSSIVLASPSFSLALDSSPEEV